MQAGLDANHRANRASGERYSRPERYEARQPLLTGAETDALRLISTRGTRLGGSRFAEELVDVQTMSSGDLKTELVRLDVPYPPSARKPELGELDLPSSVSIVLSDSTRG